MQFGKELLFFPFLLLYHTATGGALELVAPLTHQALVGKIAKIPCKYKLENFPVNPVFFAIRWYKDKNPILTFPDNYTQTEPRYSLDTERALHGTADLSVSNISGFDGGIYTCSVTYSPEKKEKDIQLDIQASPQIEITRKVVVANKESVLRSSITGFYPEDIDITWLRDGELLGRVTTEKRQRNRDGTYSASSSVTITPTEEDRKRTFSCRVQHQSLREPLQSDFQLVYGAPPRIVITSNLVVTSGESVLRSSVTGFFPEDIDITWLRDGKLLGGVTTEKPQSNPDGTYSTSSSVTITPTEEDRKRTFSCRVQHQSLREPLQSDFQLVYEDVTVKNGLIITVAVLLLLLIITTAVYITRYKKLRRTRHKSVPSRTSAALHGRPTSPVLTREEKKKEKNREMETLLNFSHMEDKATENAAATTKKREEREAPGVSNTVICIDKSSKPAEHGNEGTEIQDGQQGVKELRQIFERKE